MDSGPSRGKVKAGNSNNAFEGKQKSWDQVSWIVLFARLLDSRWPILVVYKSWARGFGDKDKAFVSARLFLF